MAITAAELRAILGVETGDSLSKLARVNAALGGVAEKAGHAGSRLGGLGGAFKSIGVQAAGFASGMLALSGLSTGFDAISGAVIGMNAELEKSTLQFETLMGDADRARKHVEGLFEFAKRTPFEAGPIIQASRYLETFGGSALNTEKTLTLLGDAAAATGAGFDEVAFWTGRMYAQLQAGKPVGEALARLTELAIISPKTRSRIEELTAAGADASKIWRVFEKGLGRFGGAMEKQASTWEGLTSTLADTFNLTLAAAARPFFEGMKSGLQSLIDFLSDPAVQDGIEAISAGLVSGLAAFGGIVSKAWGQAAPFVSGLAGLATRTISPLLDALIDLGGAIDGTGRSIGDLATTILSALTQAGTKLLLSVEEWALALGDWALDAMPGLTANLTAFAQALFDWITETGVPMAATAFARFAETAVAWLTETAIPRLGERLPALLSTVTDFVVENAPKLGERLVEWSRSFVGWVARVAPPLLAKLGELAGKIVVWIVTQGVPKLVDGAVKLGGALITGITDSLTGSGGQGRGILATVSNFITRSLIPGLLGLGGQFAKAGLDLATQLGKSFANGLVGLLEGAINAIIRGINSFKINFAGLDLGPLGRVGAIRWGGFNLPLVRLPRFEAGAWELPRTTLGLLHRGEMVVPRWPAEALREALSARSRPATTATINLHIETFYGTEQNVRELSRALGREVRAAIIASYSAGSRALAGA